MKTEHWLHILIGTIGSSLTEGEYNTLKEEGYAYNDKIGKSGIEAAFEEELRARTVPKWWKQILTEQ